MRVAAGRRTHIGFRADVPKGADEDGSSSPQSTTNSSSLEGEFAPAGQHVFGRNLNDDDRLDTFHACLEYADVDVHRLVASCYGSGFRRTRAQNRTRKSADGTYHHDTIDESA